MKQRKNGANNNADPGSTSGPTHTSRPGMLTRLYNMIHEVLFPIFIIFAAPNFMLTLWYGAVHLGGSYYRLFEFYREFGLIGGQWKLWTMTPLLSPFSLAVLGGYMAWSLLTMRLLPGRRFEGPLTPNGHLPVYKDNGFLCYLVTMAAFTGIAFYLKAHGSSVTVVYDRFNELLVTINVFSLVFCLFLYLKGILAPSTPDHSSTGNILFDYYWGTELYPRVFGFDVKVFTNCRFGMTSWPLLVCIFAIKSYELHGLRECMVITTVLQMLYLTKFFWWEGGYYRTMDIIVDRAGFYICWGCLVFVPGFYTSVSLYMVNQAVDLGYLSSGAILLGGLISLFVNYDADAQRQYVREQNGNCKVWGKPAKVIEAKYRLTSGEERTSILLASGYWGLSRHFHYVPELTLSFCWSAGAGFQHIMPFTYSIFLFMLLMHRSFRDDWKCRAKYGKYWEQYCKKVPYKVVPSIF